MTRWRASSPCTRPDHPGTSEGDPESHRALDDMWDLALFYDELFDKLGLEAPALVGHSFGGMVAGDIAANFPKRIGKLVLIDSLGHLARRDADSQLHGDADRRSHPDDLRQSE